MQGATGPLGVRVRVGDNGHVTHSIIRFPLAINHPEIKECLFHVVKKYVSIFMGRQTVIEINNICTMGMNWYCFPPFPLYHGFE